MKFDISTFPESPEIALQLAKTAEAIGFDGFWTAEVAHNPFLPLVLAAYGTQKIELGTQIAVAFPRSPMVTAQIAWDLAKQSNGRFILGLGTQVRAHIVGRFSMEWDKPISRMREYIESLRAIWCTFQTGERLRYTGEHYTFKLMTPFFNPGTIDHPDIPIYIAGVNEKICQLAGQHCQGLHAHGFHTEKYLREIVIPNVQLGLEKSNGNNPSCNLTIPIFTVIEKNDAEYVKEIAEIKSRIAFYASTPTYKIIMELHEWHDTREKLSQMARNGEWG